MEVTGKKRIGEILVGDGIISQVQLEDALKEQKKTPGVLLGSVLVKLGFATEESIARALSRQLNIPFMDLQHYNVDVKVVESVPAEMMRRFHMVPLFKVEKALTVAMSNPLDIAAIDEIQKRTGFEINIVVSTPTMISRAVENCFSACVSIKEILQDVDFKTDSEVSEIQDEVLTGKIEEYPVVKLVNLIIAQALKERASDIHIEPYESALCVRYRIDGVLHEAFKLPKQLEKTVISRIKIISGMNITEKHISQDGHIEMKLEDKIVDFRVATYPTILGESVAMRILLRGGIVLGLRELGFETEMFDKLKAMINQPYGLILTTGPTGSGKTTTLYAVLSIVNSIEKKVITVEDPVEYQLEGVSQAQINLKAGVTFAAGLRAILRQDPDIIMVGEIRDAETAQITIQSALTGHLVFSSLHTNDAPSTVTRLVDMGIEPFLVASTLLCSIGQRLVRVLCPKCKEAYTPSLEERKKLGNPNEQSSPVIYKAVGCKFCNKTGFHGRTGIFEFMVPDEEIRRLIVNKSPTSLIRQAAISAGMKPLWEVGVHKVLAGQTSITELLRVAYEEE
ncbi:MAG: ATPase, T2SS/T4P/T4SS family [Candidatus Omnitrophota bacterium]